MRRYLIPMLVGSILLAAALGYWVGRLEINSLRREYRREQAINRELKQNLSRERVALFYVQSTATQLFLQPEIRELEAKPDIYQAVVNAVLEGPTTFDSSSTSIFPEGAKVLGVQVDDGLAIVNLNQKATELNVGSEGEYLAVLSIVNTLTKLPDIYHVKFMVEGEEVESLAGHVDLTQTFSYHPEVVRVNF
ncbi:MAG TPA: GerMN domain-containing protein [Bacillota bacterium]|nr:GerMN domain-containing protein [Bacillota bacterium]HPT86713.1 GerMN domain-containing protein [Bacillota bacterium]